MEILKNSLVQAAEAAKNERERILHEGRMQQATSEAAKQAQATTEEKIAQAGAAQEQAASAA